MSTFSGYPFRVTAPLGLRIRSAPVNGTILRRVKNRETIYGIPMKSGWLSMENGEYASTDWLVYCGYIEVKSDFELYGMSRPERNDKESGSHTPKVTGLPQVHKLKDSKYIPLTKEIQTWWYKRLAALNPKMTEKKLKSGWASLLAGDRAFTNKKGSDEYVDYINGTNLNKEPIMLEGIVTGGAILEVIGQGRIAGEDCWKVKTMTTAKPIDKQEEIFFIPTISRRDGTIIGFPQFDNTIVPVISRTGYNWIEKSKCKFIGE